MGRLREAVLLKDLCEVVIHLYDNATPKCGSLTSSSDIGKFYLLSTVWDCQHLGNDSVYDTVGADTSHGMSLSLKWVFMQCSCTNLDNDYIRMKHSRAGNTIA